MKRTKQQRRLCASNAAHKGLENAMPISTQKRIGIRFSSAQCITVRALFVRKRADVYLHEPNAKKSLTTLLKHFGKRFIWAVKQNENF